MARRIPLPAPPAETHVPRSCASGPAPRSTPSRRPSSLARDAAGLLGVLLCAVPLRATPITPNPQAAAPYAGCYRLTLGPWEPDLDLGGEAIFVAMPSSIRLSDEIGREGFEKGRFLLRDLPGGRPGKGPPSYWRIEAKNEIVLVWTDGFTVVKAELSRGKNGLRGRAETHWDFPRPVQRRDVTATPMPCPQP